MSAALDQRHNPESLEIFLAELRTEISSGSQDGDLELFDVFAQEARVCRAWLDPKLKSLPADSPILEVGAGLMLTACQLQREGFAVMALEPIGQGFTGFTELQKRILEYAVRKNCAPVVLPIPAEELAEKNVFSLAYSFNVMEHVVDVSTALNQIINALKDGGEYWFTCPNYLFPYEPHFNIPTLFSKRLTEWVFSRRIKESTNVSDPDGTWDSLNWITVLQVSRILLNIGHVRFLFDKTFMERTLMRIVSDPVFASRRSLWLRRILTAVVQLGLHRLVRLIPATLQPIIDCHVLVKRVT